MKRKLIVFIPTILLVISCSSKKAVVVANHPPSRENKNHEGNTGNNVLVKKYTADEYIQRFKDIAIAEMARYGIPASITLAQALLESGNGNGTLAREANNHFGIKCTSEWDGKKIYQDDDQEDECFRVYKNPEESFRDHSEFLKRKRYALLFELDKNDYEGWAKGLKQAGYATNPRYPELLISLVQRYNLDRYDQKESIAEKTEREDKVLAEIAQNALEEKKEESAKAPVSMKIYEVKQGDTLYSVSKRFGLTVDELKLLNNIQTSDLNLGQLLLVSK